MIRNLNDSNGGRFVLKTEQNVHPPMQWLIFLENQPAGHSPLLSSSSMGAYG